MNPDPDEHVHPGQEDLQWGSGIKEKQRGQKCLCFAVNDVDGEDSEFNYKKPHSKYWFISERARKIIPGESKCKMFCGGKTCRYCNPDVWTPEQMVVNGLYSEWVTDNILAMARPCAPHIEKYKIVDQLKSLDVKTIINLQEPGEHAACGAGNEESGFSYSPQTFMENGFYFYNFAMPDYGVAPLSTLLDIVKVMQFAVSLGKVAVHCHAGLGRTGMIIACYLIYNNRVHAGKCVQYVRSRRAGSIQTKRQMKSCHEFEQYIKLFFIIFPSKIPGAQEFSFSRFLIRQRHLLHGYEARKLKHIPKVVYVCCERLLELCGKGKALATLRETAHDPVPPGLMSLPSVGDRLSLAGDSLSSARDLSPDNFDNHSLSASVQSDDVTKNVTSSVKSKKTENVPNSVTKSQSPDRHVEMRKDQSKISSFMDSLSSERTKKNNVVEEEEEEDDDDSIVYGYSSEELDHAVEIEAKKAEEEEVQVFNERRKSLHISEPSRTLDVTQVCQAILKTEYSEEKLETINQIETDLNTTDEIWQQVANTDDPDILCAVLWDWLDQLNEPVLRAQDVSYLLEHASDLKRAMMHLETSTKYFLEYIAIVLSKLNPNSTVVERFLSHLCQKRIGPAISTKYSHWDEARVDVSSQLISLFLNLIESQK